MSQFRRRHTYMMTKGKTTFNQAKPIRAGSPLRLTRNRLKPHMTRSGTMKMPLSTVLAIISSRPDILAASKMS